MNIGIYIRGRGGGGGHHLYLSASFGFLSAVCWLISMFLGHRIASIPKVVVII